MKKRVVILSALVALLGGLFAFQPALAQNDPLGLRPGAASGLGNTDVRETGGQLINVVLSLIGIIMLLLVVYAGFLWMTAAGNDDQIKTAKSILSAAIIGLVIILSAYSITTFVVERAIDATELQAQPQ